MSRDTYDFRPDGYLEIEDATDLDFATGETVEVFATLVQTGEHREPAE